MQFIITLLALVVIMLIAVTLRVGIAWVLASVFTYFTGITEISGVAVLHIAIGVALLTMLFNSNVTVNKGN